MSLTSSQGKTIVKSIRNNSSSEQAGISVNDEIIGCNGIRVNKKSLDIYFNTISSSNQSLIIIVFEKKYDVF